MGQKVNPNGLRLGIIKDWDCRWFDPKPHRMAINIKEDYDIRQYIVARLKKQKASLSKIVIERTNKNIKLHLYTARPGIVVGRNGEEISALSQEVSRITGKEVKIDVVEVKKPEMDAQLVGDNIASQLEGRVAFKRAVKQAIQQAERVGCEGIKIQVSGRLGGIEIARTEQYKTGKIPLHTLRANIDYAESTAFTITGTVGIKVWIYKGETIIQKIDMIEEEEIKNLKERRQAGRTRGGGGRRDGGGGGRDGGRRDNNQRGKRGGGGYKPQSADNDNASKKDA